MVITIIVSVCSSRLGSRAGVLCISPHKVHGKVNQERPVIAPRKGERQRREGGGSIRKGEKTRKKVRQGEIK